MFNHISEMLSNDSNKSSARLINFMGAILGAGLLAFDTYTRKQLDPTNFGIYMAYCGGVYTFGKALEKVGKNDKSIS